MSGRWLLRLYPRTWRVRYGDEVGDLLASSRRPLRDRFDLLLGAARLRGDQLRPYRWATFLLIAAGLGGAVWAVPQLQDGIVEVPGHWWSSLAVLPLVAGLVLLAASFLTSGPSGPSGMDRRSARSPLG